MSLNYSNLINYKITYNSSISIKLVELWEKRNKSVTVNRQDTNKVLPQNCKVFQRIIQVNQIILTSDGFRVSNLLLNCLRRLTGPCFIKRKVHVYQVNPFRMHHLCECVKPKTGYQSF